MTQEVVFLNLADAARLAGYAKPGSLRRFVHRWNTAHPEAPIRRLHGRVERVSLLRALEKQADRFTASSQRAVRAAAAAMRASRSVRSPHSRARTQATTAGGPAAKVVTLNPQETDA